MNSSKNQLSPYDGRLFNQDQRTSNSFGSDQNHPQDRRQSLNQIFNLNQNFQYNESSRNGISLCKIFVGGLHWETTDANLRNYFERYGEVSDAVVMKDPISKRSRGFGFITYRNEGSVEKALAIPEHVVDNRRVEAKKAVPRMDIQHNLRNQMSNSQDVRRDVRTLSQESSRTDMLSSSSQWNSHNDYRINTDANLGILPPPNHLKPSFATGNSMVDILFPKDPNISQNNVQNEDIRDQLQPQNNGNDNNNRNSAQNIVGVREGSLVVDNTNGMITDHSEKKSALEGEKSMTSKSPPSMLASLLNPNVDNASTSLSDHPNVHSDNISGNDSSLYLDRSVNDHQEFPLDQKLYDGSFPRLSVSPVSLPNAIAQGMHSKPYNGEKSQQNINPYTQNETRTEGLKQMKNEFDKDRKVEDIREQSIGMHTTHHQDVMKQKRDFLPDGGLNNDFAHNVVPPVVPVVNYFRESKSSSASQSCASNGERPQESSRDSVSINSRLSTTPSSSYSEISPNGDTFKSLGKQNVNDGNSISRQIHHSRDSTIDTSPSSGMAALNLNFSSASDFDLQGNTVQTGNEALKANLKEGKEEIRNIPNFKAALGSSLQEQQNSQNVYGLFTEQQGTQNRNMNYINPSQVLSSEGMPSTQSTVLNSETKMRIDRMNNYALQIAQNQYNMQQQHGQCHGGALSSPINVSNPPSGPGSISGGSDDGQENRKKIFVGGLHYETKDPEFRKYFEQFGNVYSAEVMFNRETQKSRGFGFVIFEEENSVDVVLQIDSHTIDSKMVEVKRAVPRNSFSGNGSQNSNGGIDISRSAIMTGASVHGFNNNFPSLNSNAYYDRPSFGNGNNSLGVGLSVHTISARNSITSNASNSSHTPGTTPGTNTPLLSSISPSFYTNSSGNNNGKNNFSNNQVNMNMSSTMLLPPNNMTGNRKNSLQNVPVKSNDYVGESMGNTKATYQQSIYPNNSYGGNFGSTSYTSGENKNSTNSGGRSAMSYAAILRGNESSNHSNGSISVNNDKANAGSIQEKGQLVEDSTKIINGPNQSLSPATTIGNHLPSLGGTLSTVSGSGGTGSPWSNSPNIGSSIFDGYVSGSDSGSKSGNTGPPNRVVTGRQVATSPFPQGNWPFMKNNNNTVFNNVNNNASNTSGSLPSSLYTNNTPPFFNFQGEQSTTSNQIQGTELYSQDPGRTMSEGNTGTQIGGRLAYNSNIVGPTVVLQGNNTLGNASIETSGTHSSDPTSKD